MGTKFLRATRVIPVLLLEQEGCYKTIKFKNKSYLGDPLNSIKIFNDLEVDEIIILDIVTSKNNITIDLGFIRELTDEACMPVTYVRDQNLDDASILNCSVEKILHSVLERNIHILKDFVRTFGSSTIVAGLDYGKDWLGRYYVHWHASKKKQYIDLISLASQYELAGCGEIMLQSVDLDGTMNGYDFNILEKISKSLQVPVVCCGGLGSLDHMSKAASLGVNGIAGGSFFVYKGAEKGILLNYPDETILNRVLP